MSCRNKIKSNKIPIHSIRAFPLFPGKRTHVLNLIELLLGGVLENICLRLREDLEGEIPVVVLQWGLVLVAEGKLRLGVDLISAEEEGKNDI